MPASAATSAAGLAPAPTPGAVPNAVPGNLPNNVPDLRDIVPPVDVPFWTEAHIVLAVAGALLLLGLLALVAWRWRKRTRPPVAPPDPRRVALEALQRLSGPDGEGLGALDFVVAVSEVLRVYLEARHQLPASRQTTEEFLEGLEHSNQFSDVVRQQLRRFLGRCDEVKFAAVHADAQVRSGLVFETVKMVKEELA